MIYLQQLINNFGPQLRQQQSYPMKRQAQNSTPSGIKSQSLISPNQCLINEDWMVTQIQTPKKLFQCPICFSFIFQPVQCKNCQRLFCLQDYRNLRLIRNVCPMCKIQPWVVLSTVHFAYRALAQKLQFSCRICKKQNIKFSIKQLTQHLTKKHDVKMFDQKSKLYKYSIVVDGERRQLNFTQNLQINHKLFQNQYEIKILDKKYGLLTLLPYQNTGSYQINNEQFQFDLQRQQATEKDNLQLGKTYQVWIFQCANQHQTGQFYLQQHQKQLQQGFNTYINHKDQESNSQIIIKSKSIQYSINFHQMVQKNLKTQFERKIARKSIKIAN